MQRPRPPAEPGQRPERGPQSDHPALTLRPATQCPDRACVGVSAQAGARGSGPGPGSDRQRSARTPLCLDGCRVSLHVRPSNLRKVIL